MAKGRMMSADMIGDPRFERLSHEAFRAFMCAWQLLDRDGLIDGRPNWLAGHCFVECDDVKAKIRAIVEEWIAQGLVIRYEGANGPILFFPDFRVVNANMPYEKESTSKYAPPPGFYRGTLGLIPNDPEVAGRLAQKFDARSSYRAALTEATKSPETGIHNEVATYSRPNHDPLATESRLSRVEVKDQDQAKEQPEVETTTTRARVRALAHEEMALVKEWNGGGGFVDSLDDEGLLCLLTWLWLYNGFHNEDVIEQSDFMARYKVSPFYKAESEVAVMISRVRGRDFAPLHPSHRELLNMAIREVQP